MRMAQANKYVAPSTTFVTSNTGSGVYYAPSTGTTTTYSASSLMGK